MEKTTFCVRIFDISPSVFTQILSRRACWMKNLILHPTSTHSAYFWWTPLSQKQEIHETHEKQEIPEKPPKGLLIPDP